MPSLWTVSKLRREAGWWPKRGGDGTDGGVAACWGVSSGRKDGRKEGGRESVAPAPTKDKPSRARASERAIALGGAAAAGV
eukprot:scaffold5466_cov342-Prasinococcus_capsulatus_cf.AAC.1